MKLAFRVAWVHSRMSPGYPVTQSCTAYQSEVGRWTIGTNERRYGVTILIPEIATSFFFFSHVQINVTLKICRIARRPMCVKAAEELPPSTVMFIAARRLSETAHKLHTLQDHKILC